MGTMAGHKEEKRGGVVPSRVWQGKREGEMF
jgi:hypothetical protein